MSTGLATRPQNQIEQFLLSRKGDLAKLASKYITPERAIQLAILCTIKNPDLQNCIPETILSSVMQAIALGLDFSPSAGEAYLVPYGKECQFQAGYQGLMKLCRNTGKVNSIQAHLVREEDKFRIWHTDGQSHYEHEPVNGAKLGKVTHAYAVARLSTGDPMIEVMTFAELELIRSRSKMKNGPAWSQNTGEMYKKTVIRRLCKSLPKSADLVAAMASIDQEYEFQDGESMDGTKPKPVDNGTGIGSGKYASAEQTATYLRSMEGYLSAREAQWLDRWQQFGEIPDDLPPYPNRWQADNHLVKWAIGLGLLDPASVPESLQKAGQIGRLTAIIYCRDKEGQRKVAKELEHYLAEKERILVDRVKAKHPELFDAAEDEPDGEAIDTEGLGDMEGGE